jgi:dephospho-CoA kinase
LDNTARCKKPIVGLAGGIGAGKTTVAKMLGELGAGVIESDALGRLEINSREVKKVLRQWWGDDVLAADGSVDRKKVASIVFRDPAQRHRLEALLHPRIAVRRADMMTDFEKQSRIKIVVLDSPLLYETDLDLMCDAVIFIDARPDVRLPRSEKTRHWTKEEIEQREKTQQPLDMKRARADHICDNNSTLAALRTQLERVFSQIVSEAGIGPNTRLR